MDEFDLIDRLIAPLATAPGAQGLRNDGAVIVPSAGCELVITKDMMAQGIHFLPYDPPDLVARKLLRVNLSDLAAMGARPLGYLMGLASDGQRNEVWFEGFVSGLRQDQEQFGISLLGGDTIAAPTGLLTLSMTAFGEVPVGRALSRDGAREGDLVAVSGTLGDAALGLRVLREEFPDTPQDQSEFLARRYRLPEARVALGQTLVGLAQAALDVSDGLLADAAHLARRSGLAITIDLPALPLSAAAQGVLARVPNALNSVLSGGDDYELLFTFPPDVLEQISESAHSSGVPVTVIGQCEAGSGVRVLDENGAEIEIEKGGWRHSG